MTSGRDNYLENIDQSPNVVIIDQCGEWYKFDDKMRHAPYEHLV